ncbi:CPBP family intramembrane metalloprotease [Staphylococcus arlettae]|uniref:intramembrane glutamic endopeptidase MroQ n=1 Tax=Staphylococcus arlettae TaxID=29378 RepID=UPI001E63A0FF|nr:type II CAAX endopeptidase family protein [Staphylococcus arlettae]MCD8889553.1 CPBP family intramembrane metalloprotease [Staphylococcus arlettae]
MSRLWVSILTLLIYGLAQFGPALILSTGILGNLSGENLRITGIATQVVLFFIAFIIIAVLHLKISNPTELEHQPKEKKRYIILWAFVGYFIVMIYQIIASLINIHILGAPQKSPNTERILQIANAFPIFIVLIAVIGPILEEYIFRKVIFGELYNILKGNKLVKFLIASIVSSILFSVAHGDPSFFIIYFGMGMIFSAFYVYTKRIWVPILIHVFQNGFVVVVQILIGPDKIKELQQSTSFIINFFI